MRRRLRVTLAASVAAGAVVLGGGTAYAEGVFSSPAKSNGVDCTRKTDKDKALKENDFPSDNDVAADSNATKKDIRDRSGNVYYNHQEFCNDPERAFRETKGDDSYNTFNYGTDKYGAPSRDHDKNTYNDFDGYNSKYRYNEKQLEPDHIGAPKSPKSATE